MNGQQIVPRFVDLSLFQPEHDASGQRTAIERDSFAIGKATAINSPGTSCRATSGSKRREAPGCFNQ